ncbi:HAD family phosphatase [Marinoscillum sp. MHG1-6]|uniref:HAD family hydrolase n=1 Tax=Marinoscillum sp. MHG1-6 TaxID=2959627 RepID=UPI002157CDBE|nr:HAD family phosphatase [Marinoscillum sp. MHG1-6]
MPSRLSQLDTIIFDLGNVIVDLQPQAVLDRFAELAPDASRDIPALIKDTDLLIKYETGKFTSEEFVTACNEFLGADIHADDFSEAWNLMIGDIPERRLDLLKELAQSYQVLILSNTNEFHEIFFEDKIRKERGVSGLDHYVHHPIYSHLIGLRKPKADIYEYVIENYLTSPSKALFLDDKAENVEAAIAVGMQSEQVEYPDQIFKILGYE